MQQASENQFFSQRANHYHGQNSQSDTYGRSGQMVIHEGDAIGISGDQPEAHLGQQGSGNQGADGQQTRSGQHTPVWDIEKEIPLNFQMPHSAKKRQRQEDTQNPTASNRDKKLVHGLENHILEKEISRQSQEKEDQDFGS